MPVSIKLEPLISLVSMRLRIHRFLFFTFLNGTNTRSFNVLFVSLKWIGIAFFPLLAIPHLCSPSLSAGLLVQLLIYCFSSTLLLHIKYKNGPFVLQFNFPSILITSPVLYILIQFLFHYVYLACMGRHNTLLLMFLCCTYLHHLFVPPFSV